MTCEKIEQIAKYAFTFARENNRKKICCVHKANIMKMGDGLFLQTCRNVATLEGNNVIEFKDLIVDNTAMQLVMRPTQFDILLLPNLYGNIMVSIGAGLVGSSGLLAGVNLNKDLAVYESATRSVANLSHSPDHLNPSSLLFAYCQLLKSIDMAPFATKVEGCLNEMMKNKQYLTPDIGGSSTTDQFLESLTKTFDQ